MAALVGAEQGQVSVTMSQRILQAVVVATSLACVLLSAVRVQAKQPSHKELLEQIQGGDRAAMLEAGNTGDTSFVPSLEAYIQTNMSALSNDLVKLEEKAQQFGRTSGLSMERELASRHSELQIQAAQMALAKLRVEKYLDEIISELTATNTPSGRELSGTEIYEVKAGALKKLAYIANPSTIKFIGPCLYDTADPYPYVPGARDKFLVSRVASDAMAALRKMITDAPVTNDFTVWQQWWEQNKGKYP